VWRWDQAEPFGNNPADEDPDGNSVAFDWASPEISDTFDRCDDDIGGVRWREERMQLSSSGRR
jgi:hypothetical protein